MAAAALKIYGWSVSTLPPVGWFSSPGVQAAAIGWEILLGAWLLCGAAMFGSWLAAIGTFTLLAGISGYLGWVGQAECGCFGTIKASPWHAFALDVAALGLLAVGHPKGKSIQTAPAGGLWRSISPAAYFVLGMSITIAGLAGMGAWVYGSSEAALARLRGELVVVKPGYIDFGAGKPGEVLKAAIEINNWSDRPVQIYGGTSDCSCVATEALPVTIPPGESQTIPVFLKVPKSMAGMFTRYAAFFVDCEQQRTLWLRIGCRVE